MARSRSRALVLAAAGAAGIAGTPRKAAVSAGDVAVLVGAGDIASCENLAGAEATARLLDGIPGTVFTAGDNAYSSGTRRQFADCYAPTWGRHKARTRPSPGNHDYYSSGAAPYFAYFGAAAGPAGRGYYSYELGSWHVVALNSNCSKVGCGVGSAQERWLRADLAAHKAPCTVAYWHHPRYSSGIHGESLETAPLWKALYDSGAEIVISGHDHDYERFAPQDADERGDPDHGVRQFVVGTGGKSTRRFLKTKPNSEARATGVFGVLKLTLRPGDYRWDFVPVQGKTFADSGVGTCH